MSTHKIPLLWEGTVLEPRDRAATFAQVHRQLFGEGERGFLIEETDAGACAVYALTRISDVWSRTYDPKITERGREEFMSREEAEPFVLRAAAWVEEAAQ